MDETIPDHSPSPVTWRSGDWVEPPNKQPPFNGIEIIATSTYEPQTQNLKALALVISDFTKQVKGAKESRQFDAIRNGETIELNASQVAAPTLANQGFQAEPQQNFTITGRLELRFTRIIPDQVLVFAFLEYGLDKNRHHVQGGILEVPQMSPAPLSGPAANAPTDAGRSPQHPGGAGTTEAGASDDPPPDTGPTDTGPTDTDPTVPDPPADVVASEQGSPQAQDLAKLLQMQSYLTEQRIQSGLARAIPQHEITLTDTNLLAIAKAAQDQDLSIKTEVLPEEELGANWLWTLPNRQGQELRILAVGKRLDDRTLSYPSLDQRAGNDGPFQVDDVIRAASQRAATPVYVLYNYVANQPSQSGCFFVLAEAIANLVRNNKKSWRDVQAEASPHPWDELLSLSLSATTSPDTNGETAPPPAS